MFQLLSRTKSNLVVSKINYSIDEVKSDRSFLPSIYNFEYIHTFCQNVFNKTDTTEGGNKTTIDEKINVTNIPSWRRNNHQTASRPPSIVDRGTRVPGRLEQKRPSDSIIDTRVPVVRGQPFANRGFRAVTWINYGVACG